MNLANSKINSVIRNSLGSLISFVTTTVERPERGARGRDWRSEVGLEIKGLQITRLQDYRFDGLVKAAERRNVSRKRNLRVHLSRVAVKHWM